MTDGNPLKEAAAAPRVLIIISRICVLTANLPLKWHCELLVVADGLLRSQLSAIAASVNTISSRTTNQPSRRRRRWRRNCAASVLLDNVTFLCSRDRTHPLVIYLSVGCADALLLRIAPASRSLLTQTESVPFFIVACPNTNGPICREKWHGIFECVVVGEGMV